MLNVLTVAKKTGLVSSYWTDHVGWRIRLINDAFHDAKIYPVFQGQRQWRDRLRQVRFPNNGTLSHVPVRK